MSTLSHVPPGFRFYPTDEELVDYYLRKKVNSRRIDLDVIKELNLYKIEPWDVQEICRIGVEEQSDWYFFSHKDKKYPTGTRTNRATKVGFWKATGRDKPVYSKHKLVGMRKTLVYYKGRAPNGQKSDWIMHEYRLLDQLANDQNATTTQEEGWVVCKVFKKKVSIIRKESDNESGMLWYDVEQISVLQAHKSPTETTHLVSSFKEDHIHGLNHDPLSSNSSFQHLLQFDIHNNIASSVNINECSPDSFTGFPDDVFQPLGHQLQIISAYNIQGDINQAVDQVTDWRVLDKFVASQLSHDISNESESS